MFGVSRGKVVKRVEINGERCLLCNREAELTVVSENENTRNVKDFIETRLCKQCTNKQHSYRALLYKKVLKKWLKRRRW